MAIFGRPNKPRRDTPADRPVRGRVLRPNDSEARVVVHAAEPIGKRMMATLGVYYQTGSRHADGNGGFASLNTGAGIVGRDARRTGALQSFDGTYRPVTHPATRKHGIQGGPSDQPAFPSTGSTNPPGIYSALAGMSLPQVLNGTGV